MKETGRYSEAALRSCGHGGLKHGTQTITESMKMHGNVPKDVLCQLDEGREGGQPVVQGMHANLTMKSFFVHSWVFCTLPLEIFTEVSKGKLSLHITSHFLVYSAAATTFQIKYKKIPGTIKTSHNI